MSTILAASLLAGVACAAGAVPLTGSTGSMPKAQVEHLAPADSPLRDVLGDTFKISILGANFSAGQAASLFSGTFAFQNGSIAGVTAFGAPLSLTLDQAQIAPNQYRLTITAQVTDPAAEILPGGVTFSNGTLITSLGLDIGDSTFGGGADGLNPASWISIDAATIDASIDGFLGLDFDILSTVTQFGADALRPRGYVSAGGNRLDGFGIDGLRISLTYSVVPAPGAAAALGAAGLLAARRRR